MGLGSKRKSPWRYRCCHRLYVALITIPVAVAIFLSVIIITRSFIVLPEANTHVLNLAEKNDLIDETKMLERAERLAGALRIPTVSYEPDVQEKQAILKLHQYLEKSKSKYIMFLTFPRVYKNKTITTSGTVYK